jgi:hypothetical protein
MPPDEEEWLDAEVGAGRLVRPYAVSEGRTSPTTKLDMLSMIMATGLPAGAGLGPDHSLALDICERPTAVAEIAARLRLPAAVTKIILSDLIDSGAVIARSPGAMPNGPDSALLRAVLDGLQAL